MPKLWRPQLIEQTEWESLIENDSVGEIDEALMGCKAEWPEEFDVYTYDFEGGPLSWPGRG